MTPEFQAILQDVSAQESQEMTGKLHRAVKDLDKARKALTAAQKAKFQFYGSWKSFLEKLVTKWSEYTTDFHTKDQALTEKVTKAQSTLESAREALRGLKETAEVTLVEDSDDEVLAPSKPPSTGNKIHEGLLHMTATLKSIQEEAESLEVEPPNKCRKVSVKEEPERMDLDQGKAQQEAAAAVAAHASPSSAPALTTPAGKTPAPFA